MHKIAGAAAEKGKSLSEVKKIADAVIDSTASLGVSLSTVSRLRPEHIGQRKMEVGLGIHGEPGARTVKTARAQNVVDMMMEDLLKSKRMQGDASKGYACIINNLGSVPPIEMGILAKGLMDKPDIKFVVGPALLMTSLDMNGFSLSLLRLTDEFSQLLQAPTPVPNWPQAIAPSFPDPIKAPDVSINKDVKPSEDATVSGAIEAICKTLIVAKKELNALDAKVGDADCGTTIETAAKRVLEKRADMPLANPKQLSSTLSEILQGTMGGSSGILLSIMFMGMANALDHSSSWKSDGAKAFRQGLQEMMDAGGAKPGMRTMLDALVPAADALVEGQGFAAAQSAAEHGAAATKTMKAKAGRSENVPDKVLKGTPDPGAVAASKVFAALAKNLS